MAVKNIVSVLAVIVAFGALLLQASCAIPLPIVWSSQEDLMLDAISAVKKPPPTSMCLHLLAGGADHIVTIDNSSYPYDKYTKFTYNASTVMQGALVVAASKWHVNNDQSTSCWDTVVAIAGLTHNFAFVGAATRKPMVGIRLRLRMYGRKAKKPVIDGYFDGWAYGKKITWADQSDARTIRDYNLTADRALFVALAKGIQSIAIHCRLMANNKPPIRC